MNIAVMPFLCLTYVNTRVVTPRTD